MAEGTLGMMRLGGKPGSVCTTVTLALEAELNSDVTFALREFQDQQKVVQEYEEYR